MGYTEEKLPNSILQKAKKRGNEYGWKKEDIFDVINEAKNHGFRCVGGQVMFYLPCATCELYWLEFDSNEKLENEYWEQWVKRSAQECIEQITRIIQEIDILEECLEFPKINEMYKKGVDVLEYCYFVCYFDEDEKT